MLLTDLIVSQGHCGKESSINDKNDWKTVSTAFSGIDFTAADLEVRPVGLSRCGEQSFFLGLTVGCWTQQTKAWNWAGGWLRDTGWTGAGSVTWNGPGNGSGNRDGTGRWFR